MKSNYIIIPLAVLFAALTGSNVTSNGMEWYATINLPSFTPSGATIGSVWTVIFILAAVSALIVWNNKPGLMSIVKGWIGLGSDLPAPLRRRFIMMVFVLNAVLNVLWSVIFFGAHNIGVAVVEAAVLGASVVILMVLIWPVSKLASWLLAPYAVWVGFATYLTYCVWVLNK